MALNDIYQLTLKQTLFGRNIENVFFYERTAPTGTAAVLVDSWIEFILPNILDIQTSSVQNVSISAINLGDLADFVDVPDDTEGNYGEVDTLPAFNAVGYSLRLNTRAVRPGSKRFAGVPEEASLNGVLVLPGYLTVVEALRQTLLEPAGVVGDTYNPIVVKRVKEEVVGTVPPKYTYRLPTTGDPLVVGEVVNVLTNRNVTSQTSRKD